MHNNLLHTPNHHIHSAQIDKYIGHTKRTRMVNLPVNRDPKSLCLKIKKCMAIKAKQDKFSKHVGMMSDNTFEWNIQNQSHTVLTF